MRRLLKLQHHAHSGKLLPHRHTSYRVLAVLLVMAGAVLLCAGWGVQQVAQAEQIDVSARVPAPIPSQPAVILQPQDGTVTNEPLITVSGTCPVVSPAITVVIYGNEHLLGSTQCTNEGSFWLQVTLTPGQNRLIARVLTITDDYGPDSLPVIVSYIPRVVGISSQPTGGAESVGQPGELQPLAINSRKPFLLLSRYKEAEWVGTISGGKPPYQLTINWGDGSITTYKNLTTEEQTFQHRYHRLKNYAVTLTAKDSSGLSVVAQFVAIAFYLPSAASLVPAKVENNLLLFVIMGAYLSLVLMVLLLWLRAHHLGAEFKLARVPVIAQPRKRRLK